MIRSSVRSLLTPQVSAEEGWGLEPAGWLAGQYAPRRLTSTGSVFATMYRSYASDQFSM
jgi:hypothetical protein